MHSPHVGTSTHHSPVSFSSSTRAHTLSTRPPSHPPTPPRHVFPPSRKERAFSTARMAQTATLIVWSVRYVQPSVGRGWGGSKSIIKERRSPHSSLYRVGHRVATTRVATPNDIASNSLHSMSDLPKRRCLKCGRHLVAVGLGRANGVGHHADWAKREYHKACWIAMQRIVRHRRTGWRCYKKKPYRGRSGYRG